MNSAEPVGPEEPLLWAGLPAAGGRLGPEPEHFVVDEIPLYEPSGSGEHWYVRLRKRRLTTPELVRRVARLAGIRERDIGYAGLKDKHAVTSQWLSLPAQALPPEGWELPSDIELLQVSKHNNKLRSGHLSANRFSITLTEVPEGGAERAREIVSALKRRGLPNYFGEQRFGHNGQNLAEALAWVTRPARRDRNKARFYDKLYPSVLQAEVFNRYLTRRLRLGLDRLVDGEVVRLSGSASVFVVEDVEREQPRLNSRDIVLTGPIFGPRAVVARGSAEALEREALQALGLSDDSLARLGKLARGTRRDLMVHLESLELEASDSADSSSLSSSLRVSFTLPSGSYATQLIRELTGAAWLEAR